MEIPRTVLLHSVFARQEHKTGKHAKKFQVSTKMSDILPQFLWLGQNILKIKLN